MTPLISGQNSPAEAGAFRIWALSRASALHVVAAALLLEYQMFVRAGKQFLHNSLLGAEPVHRAIVAVGEFAFGAAEQ